MLAFAAGCVGEAMDAALEGEDDTYYAELEPDKRISRNSRVIPASHSSRSRNPRSLRSRTPSALVPRPATCLRERHRETRAASPRLLPPLLRGSAPAWCRSASDRRFARARLGERALHELL